MVYEVVTTLDGPEVLRRAKLFFAERVPLNAAYPEREGPTYLTLRGQGGEEIAFAVWSTPGGTRIRASTLFFDQVVDQFERPVRDVEEEPAHQIDHRDRRAVHGCEWIWGLERGRSRHYESVFAA